mgnify:CR=1 FL=1
MGCIVCSKYTVQHPDRVEHLVLTSPAGVGNTPFVNTTPFQNRVWDSGLLTPMDVIRWLGFIPGLCYSRHYGAARALRSPQGSSFRTMDIVLFSDYSYFNYALPASGERAISLLLHADGRGKYPIIDILKGRIECPVSIVYGDQQYDWIKRFDGDILHEQLRAQGVECSIRELPEAGHMLMLDNTAGFNTLIPELCRLR